MHQAQINRHYRDRDCESKINNKDLKLAIKLKQMNSFTRPISQAFTQKVAEQKNEKSLAELILG